MYILCSRCNIILLPVCSWWKGLTLGLVVLLNLIVERTYSIILLDSNLATNQVKIEMFVLYGVILLTIFPL
jgi:hypothetical protein